VSYWSSSILFSRKMESEF